jgi:DNA (cytosine-5)-methyltransferase 1
VENVAALLGRGLADVLADLAALGYDAEWHCIPAAAVGAPHRRDRLWIVAYADGAGLEIGPRLSRDIAKELAAIERSRAVMADADESRPSEGWEQQSWELVRAGGDQGAYSSGRSDGHWVVEPDVGRMAHGVPARMDRLKALGNAVIPQIPELIGRAILQGLAA